MKKYKIEKDTVQETLLIPLYGRKLSSERFPALFTDDSAARLMAKIDYDFSALEKRSDSIVQVFGRSRRQCGKAISPGGCATI